MSRAELSKVHTKIFEAAAEIHSILGPGLPSQVYRSSLLHEFRIKGLMFKKDICFPVIYKDHKAGELVVEFLVENNIIIDCIQHQDITSLHVASMQSKLKLTGMRMGIIITFNTLNIIDGYRKVLINQ